MITYDFKNKIFMLNTLNSTYAMKVTDANDLIHLHWGEKTECVNDLPTVTELKKVTTLAEVDEYDCREYIEWGRNTGIATLDPAIMVEFEDGTRDLILKYKSHKISKEDETEVLTITLKDIAFDFEIDLVYKVIEEFNIIERNCRIRNTGKNIVFLNRAFSASLFLPYRDNYRLTTLTGTWAGEYQINRQYLGHNRVAMRTLNGQSGPDYVPFFMLDEGDATENKGSVFYGTVFWSGNWQMYIEKDGVNRTCISGGISDFDFKWQLKPNDCFETPKFVIGFETEGFGSASRNIHRYEKKYVMCHEDAQTELPLVYNAYGTFMSQINEEKTSSVIDKAADLGVELFVMDSGWNGHGDDQTFTFRHGFGDWEVNKDRFPNGLGEISRKIHSRGMKFGIWMEPEAINTESELYKKHPDWVHEFPGRVNTESPHKYVLNFAIDEAADYITNKIIKLIEDYNLDYFKMDCNMGILMAWKNCPTEQQREVWVRHINNLYRCYRTVKAKFPHVIIENCAAGGYRADLGMLEFSGRMNRSDNQDTLDILKLHEGYSMFMLPRLAGGGCHISDVYTAHINSRKSTMKFQAYVGMMGSLAIGKNLNTITPEEEVELKEYTALYKEIRPIIHHGDFYRLESAFEKPYSAYEYVAEDKKDAVLFAFSSSMQFARMPERIRLEGLDENSMYDCGEYGIRSGKGLMSIGLQVPLRGDMDSKLIRIKAVK